jgi:hypothetical protein
LESQSATSDIYLSNRGLVLVTRDTDFRKLDLRTRQYSV